MEESERLVEALQADILALRKKLGKKKQDATGKGFNLGTESGDPADFSSRVHGAVFNLCLQPRAMVPPSRETTCCSRRPSEVCLPACLSFTLRH